MTENQEHTIWKTDQMIQVQEGSVVSRTLINEKAGTVTLFAFDANQGLSEHTAPYNALAHLIEGKLTISLGGTPFNLEPGDMLLMPANVPHALKAETRVKFLLTMIRA